MGDATHLEQKYAFVLENEQALTNHVAGDAIDKPQLALWMILIPVFFVFYFFQFKRYKNGLKSFKANFIITRKGVLDLVYQAMENKEKPDIEDFVEAGNVPTPAQAAYREWVAELAVCFQALLQADGDDYPALVTSCYRKKSNYLIALNRLNDLEKALNSALLPELASQDAQAAMAVASIEKSTAHFRRTQAKTIFSH